MVFYNKTIFVIYMVAYLDIFSVSMVSVTFPHYLRQELGMSATIAGSISSIYGIVQFFSSPVVGRWSDLHGYRRVMVLTLLLCVPAYFSLATHQWTVVVLSRIIAGSFKHTQNLSRTFLSSFVTEDEKIRAYGRLSAMGNVGFIAGPAFSALLLKYHGYSSIFFMTSASFLMNAIIIYTCIPKSLPGTKSIIINISDTKNDDESSLAAMFREVHWRRYWDLFATKFFSTFGVLLYRSSYNWVMTDKFQADAVVQNYLASYQGVVAFLSSYYCNTICSWYNNDTLKIYKYVIVLLFLTLLGLVMSPTFIIFAMFLAPLCISTSIKWVVSLDLTTERCDNCDLGLILGASGSVTAMARAISPALGGILHDLNQDFPALLGMGCLMISYVITARYTYPNQLIYKRIRPVHILPIPI